MKKLLRIINFLRFRGFYQTEVHHISYPVHVIRAKNIETSMNFTIKKACINLQEKNPECQLS
jgi:hypothetical protein